MSDTTAWFATFEIKENQLEEFFSYLDKKSIAYDNRNQSGNTINLRIWDEPPLEEGTTFWIEVRKYCKSISASEYVETGESIQYPEEEEDGTED